MSTKFIIEGGHRLNGEVQVSGAKNAALPILAATLLTREPMTVHNVPRIKDILVMLEVIESLGGKVEWIGDNSVQIDNSEIDGREPDFVKIKKLRASILILGPLLARSGKVKISQPGGCHIGPRPIDTHLNGLRALGASVEGDGEFYSVTTDGLVGSKIVLDEMSVTGTSNVIMAAVLAQGKSEIRLAAAEPENNNLVDILIQMGAKISGRGTHTLMIDGLEALHGAEVTVIPDRLEAGTLAIAAALTHGEVTIKGYVSDHLDAFTAKLLQAGVRLEVMDPETVKVNKTVALKAVDIKTAVYPAFPTDLQAPFGCLLTQAQGTSQIHETMYDGRLNYFKELAKMGATANILDPHRAVVSGPTVLYGKEIDSLDIRAGATLILAALIANGKSTINKAELIDRGYERIDEKLNALGAKVERIEDPEVV